MIKIRLAALLIFILVIGTGIPKAEMVKVGDPMCLVNECGPRLGLFTAACRRLCVLAGYSHSVCVQPRRSQAKCTCLGQRKSLFIVDTVCNVLIGPVCKLCGYKGVGQCVANAAFNVTRAYCR